MCSTRRSIDFLLVAANAIFVMYLSVSKGSTLTWPRNFLIASVCRSWSPCLVVVPGQRVCIPLERYDRRGAFIVSGVVWKGSGTRGIGVSCSCIIVYRWRWIQVHCRRSWLRIKQAWINLVMRECMRLVSSHNGSECFFRGVVDRFQVLCSLIVV